MRNDQAYAAVANTLLLSTSIALGGCGDDGAEVVPPPPPEDPYENTPSGDGAPQGLGLQSWGIGAKWYDYDGDTHSVLPTDEAWYVVRDGETWHLSINQYYNREGTSGHPDMIVQRWNANSQSWTRVGRWEASAKVGSLIQCFRLEAPASAKSGEECASFDYDVIWRADFRPIPTAGFAISNPGFYVATDKGGEVFNVQMKQPTSDLSLLATENSVRIRSIFDHDAISIIEERFFSEGEGSSDNTVISLTGDLQAAQWRLVDNDGVISVQSRCASVNTTDPSLAPELNDAPNSLELDLASAQAWTLIDLCGENGPSVAFELETLRPGLWPSNNAFDLAIQKSDTGLTLWMTPEQVMMPIRGGNWDPILVPSQFWD